MNKRSYLLFRLKNLKNLLKYTASQSPVNLGIARNLVNEINSVENSIKKIEKRFKNRKFN